MQWGQRKIRAQGTSSRPIWVDALSPLHPQLAEGYPASERPAASRIAYVIFLASWPMLALALVGMWGDAPLASTGTAAATVIIMIQARRLAHLPRPRTSGLFALVAISGLASGIVALREEANAIVVGRAGLVAIIVVGLSAVLLSKRRPLPISLAWSSFPVLAVALPLFTTGESWLTITIESLKAGSAFMAGAILMRIIHQTLQDRQDRYAGLLELSAIGIMELDLTRVAAFFKGLAISGVTDISSWIDEDAERTYELMSKADVTNMNETMALMLGVDHSEDSIRRGMALISSLSVAESVQGHLYAMWHGAETAVTQGHITNRRGNTRALLLHTARRRTENGFDNAHVVLTAVDVEDRREAENELQRQVERREQLIASVSHELRTPMASVIGFADELLERPEDFGPDERRELLEFIRSQSVDVANILDDLLVKARADFDDVTVMCADVDVSVVTARLIEELGMQDEVAANIPETYVWADRTRLRQILRNLLTNARRYGGAEVRVVAEKKGDNVHISVRDSGEPLDLETSKNIFEAFERAHNVIGVTASVGLGLTIARQLARAMDGEVWYAHDGAEAAFTLVLPALPPPPQEPVLVDSSLQA